MKAPPAVGRWLLAATGGGVACLVGDHLHVVNGVLSYPHPVFWNQAWWVFPLFFGATIVCLAGAELIHLKPPPADDLAAAGDTISLLTAYAFTAFAHTLPDVVLWVLIGWWVARVLQGMPPSHVLFCILVALCGTSWEAMWSGLGMFTYQHPDFLGVPRWLPALYLHAGVTADSARRMVVRS